MQNLKKSLAISLLISMPGLLYSATPADSPEPEITNIHTPFIFNESLMVHLAAAPKFNTTHQREIKVITGPETTHVVIEPDPAYLLPEIAVASIYDKSPQFDQQILMGKAGYNIFGWGLGKNRPAEPLNWPSYGSAAATTRHLTGCVQVHDVRQALGYLRDYDRRHTAWPRSGTKYHEDKDTIASLVSAPDTPGKVTLRIPASQSPVVTAPDDWEHVVTKTVDYIGHGDREIVQSRLYLNFTATPGTEFRVGDSYAVPQKRVVGVAAAGAAIGLAAIMRSRK